MGHITLFRPERRRRWNDEERLDIPNKASPPGACNAEVARRQDVSTALVYTWRRKLRDADVESVPAGLAAPGFATALMVEDVGVATSGLQPPIVIDLARRKRISIFASASPALESATEAVILHLKLQVAKLKREQ